MFGSRFIAPRVAVLTAACSGRRARPMPRRATRGAPHGGGSGGYHGSSGGYHGRLRRLPLGYYVGYRSGYSGGYRPGYFSGLGVGLYYSPFYGADYGGAYGAAYTPPAYAYPSPSPALYSGGGEGDLGPAVAATAGAAAALMRGRGRRRRPRRRRGLVQRRPDETDGRAARQFVTPTLPVGRAYQYEIRARWKANGEVVDQTATAMLDFNQRTDVDFTRAEPIDASIPAPPE